MLDDTCIVKLVMDTHDLILRPAEGTKAIQLAHSGWDTTQPLGITYIFSSQSLAT